MTDIMRGVYLPPPQLNNGILIVGEVWGDNDEKTGKPFSGTAGDELTKMLHEAGINRNHCMITNLVSARPKANEIKNFFYTTKEAKASRLIPLRGLYPQQIVVDGLRTLHEQIKILKPKAVIGLGNYVLWALTEDCFTIINAKGYKVPSGLTSWRGSQLYIMNTDIPLMPTYHPTAVMWQWSWRYVVVHDLRQRLPKALKGQWAAPEVKFMVSPSFGDTMNYIQAIHAALPCKVAVDLETAFHHIGCVGLATSKNEAICIPFWRKDTQEAYWTPEEEVAVVMELRALLLDPRCKIIGQNFLYDAQYTALYWGLIPTVYLDTLLFHHLCWPGTPRGLDYLSSLYCNYHRYWKDEGKSWHPSFSDHQQWTYNCKDCIATYEVADALEKVITFLHLEEQAKFQMEQFHLALSMMLRGARIDLIARARLSNELEMTKQKLGEWLKNIIPQSVLPTQKKKAPWYASPQQTMHLLYDVLGIDGGKEKSSDEEALQSVMTKEPILRPILENILAYRSVRIFKKNFIDARLGEDDRLRCSFDPAGTKTFRWASRQDAFDNGANLQTIPKGREI